MVDTKRFMKTKTKQTQKRMSRKAILKRYFSDIVDVRDKVADLSLNCWFSGPTEIDFSMLPVIGRIRDKENDLFHEWKEMDLTSMYREQQIYTQGSLW